MDSNACALMASVATSVRSTWTNAPPILVRTRPLVMIMSIPTLATVEVVSLEKIARLTMKIALHPPA